MTRAEVTAKLTSVLLPNRKQRVTDHPTGAPQDTHFHVHKEDTDHQPHSFSFHLFLTTTLSSDSSPVTVAESGAHSSLVMEIQDLLQRLTEVNIRQQQIVEHLATWQSRAEEEIAAVRLHTAQHIPLPDPRAQATRLIPKMTAHDDVEAFLQVFESTATREGWAVEEWALALAPLLTGEAQRTYFSMPPALATNYNEAKREILARLGLSPICAVQQFHEYKTQVPARAQAAELTRVAQHWLLEGEPTTAQVVERVVINRLLRGRWVGKRSSGGRAARKRLAGLRALAGRSHSARRPASPRGNRRRRRHPQGLRRRPALLASDSGRDGESPSQSTNLFYDVFQQASGGGSFAKEQREDDRLKHCWSQVRIIDGNDVLPRPHPLPYFMVKQAKWGEGTFGGSPEQDGSQGPYTVIEKMGPVTYRLRQPRRRQAEQIYHINLLKKWHGTRDRLAAHSLTDPVVVDVNPQLSAAQKTELQHLVDLTKGYWQVPLTPTAREKTAFSTPSGHWQYWTLPFGLHGAPATFQRMMDVLLRPHQAYAAAYLDDVVVHSEAWEDHLDWLRRVLSELWRAGLTANPRKCHLATSEAKYLGFQVGRGLIRPQEKKVDAILTTPKPETKSQVRAFLGLAGYYRCFIPNFSSLATPLTDLTRKGQPEKIRWTLTAEEALARIRTALTSAPVLRAPDFSCPFLLQTDASDSELGAVLSRVQEGEEHPILYISRKLSPAERNYATVEREALAIRWAVLELRYYLLGRKFTLVTDHAPLQWMARAKDTNARVTCWFLALQDFHFDVRHRAGADNANADGLSRSWTAYAGLSGVIPRPPLVSPLLSPFVPRARTTLKGGECDKGYWAHQRRPGYKPAAPARPHHQRSATAAASLPARLYKPRARYKLTV
ncbi:hypothetical protein M9458_051729 [Cirrhinus mrigala]|uniref:ribonuclease H n=1 Tax=Cirrhinus mrigala TaxID=683832 RepID=A0ABD0MWM3_CIRMR